VADPPDHGSCRPDGVWASSTDWSRPEPALDDGPLWGSPALIVTSGMELVQQWGGPIQVIEHGDVVWIPPVVKHWHGATRTTCMTQIAIAEALNRKSVAWMELVTEAQYPASQPKIRGQVHLIRLAK
jgi:hypothetical protein